MLIEILFISSLEGPVVQVSIKDKINLGSVVSILFTYPFLKKQCFFFPKLPFGKKKSRRICLFILFRENFIGNFSSTWEIKIVKFTRKKQTRKKEEILTFTSLLRLEDKILFCQNIQSSVWHKVQILHFKYFLWVEMLHREIVYRKIFYNLWLFLSNSVQILLRSSCEFWSIYFKLDWNLSQTWNTIE